jgi:hypothetical protein
MADRKISELSTASRVFDADFMVVVTGVNQLVPGQSDVYVEKVTTKFPLSGLSTWVFRVNEVVSGCTGIQIVPQINTGVGNGRPNTISICTTGVSYVGHTHTASNITDFNSTVSGLVQQQLKLLSTETANSVAGSYQTLSGLSINLANNSQYVCELGLITSGINTTQVTGLVSSTGIAASNGNLLTVYGTWNYVSDSGLYNSSTSVTGSRTIANNLTSTQTVVTKFTASTHATESDQLNIRFTANDINGKILAGSWFKVEKVI